MYHDSDYVLPFVLFTGMLFLNIRQAINGDIKNVSMYVGFHDISLIKEFPMKSTDVALSVV